MSAATQHQPETEAPAVSIQGLSKRFISNGDTVQALKNIDLSVGSGELVVLLGPSGCGKTTLLRCIAGLERPDGGSISLGGEIVSDPERHIHRPPNKRRIGMVFQQYALWPHKRVRANVEFPLKAQGLKTELRSGRVDEVLSIVQCQYLADRYPSELSGGQQQRVALSRALVGRPTVMLLDEPLSSLDALLREDLRTQLRQLHRQLGFTGLYVTHDQMEAMSVATRIIVMRDGEVEQDGSPESVSSRPETEYVADFIGIRNVFMLGDEPGAVAKAPGLTSTPEVRQVARLSPENLRVRAPGSDGQTDDSVAVVHGVEVTERFRRGASVEYILDGANTRYTAIRPPNEPVIERGTAVRVEFDWASALLYEDGRLLDSPHRN